MIKKPDVLSDEQIMELEPRFKEMDAFICDGTDFDKVAKAQRDADAEYYEPLIKEMHEALERISVILANPLTTRNEPTLELREVRARDEAWIISREALAKVDKGESPDLEFNHEIHDKHGW